MSFALEATCSQKPNTTGSYARSIREHVASSAILTKLIKVDRLTELPIRKLVTNLPTFVSIVSRSNPTKRVSRHQTIASHSRHLLSIRLSQAIASKLTPIYIHSINFGHVLVNKFRPLPVRACARVAPKGLKQKGYLLGSAYKNGDYIYFSLSLSLTHDLTHIKYTCIF